MLAEINYHKMAVFRSLFTPGFLREMQPSKVKTLHLKIKLDKIRFDLNIFIILKVNFKTSIKKQSVGNYFPQLYFLHYLNYLV